VYSHSREDDCQQGNRPSQGMVRRRYSQFSPPLLLISSSFDSELRPAGFLLEQGKLPLNANVSLGNGCVLLGVQTVSAYHIWAAAAPGPLLTTWFAAA